MAATELHGTITVLVENRAADGTLGSEHGLSLWIETTAGAILFDTGQSGRFAENAKRLGIDLATADAIVVSHGHYDHAGGLAQALGATRAPVYLAGDAAIPKQARDLGRARDIGMDASVLTSVRERLVYADAPIEILPGIMVLPAARVRTPPPDDNQRLLRAGPNGLQPDPFSDERSLLIDAADSVLLVTGCSHRGIVNILTDAREIARHGGFSDACASGAKPWRIAGGLHLSHESAASIRRVAGQLADLSELHAGHCTGEIAFQILCDELPGRVHPLAAGTSWSF